MGGMPMLRALYTCLLLIGGAGWLPAVTIHQVETFEDGVLEWFVPSPDHPNPPAIEASGGPAGAGGAYLRLVATGAGLAGSRLAALNESLWTGNYLAAGISAIRMDVNNF